MLVSTLDRSLKLNIIDQLSVDRLVLKDDPCDRIQVTSSSPKRYFQGLKLREYGNVERAGFHCKQKTSTLCDLSEW